MKFDADGYRLHLIKEIHRRKYTYGFREQCRGCRHECKEIDYPGVTMSTCLSYTPKLISKEETRSNTKPNAGSTGLSQGSPQ